MTFRSRIALLAAGLALVCTVPVQAGLLPKIHLGSSHKADEPAKNSAWPQTRSDVAADPAVRFGVLANGMRYAIAHSSTPKGEASLRLRFDAGSLDETASEQGLAHFLEHMAFNGSAHVPEGDMVKILQRHGLAFGADTNASTSWTETIYQLDLPSTADETVDTGLMLMRETAGNLTLVQDAVNRERGVVLAEERTRDSPGLRVYKQNLSFDLKGQLAADRLPIGKTSVIANASTEQLRTFYQHYYRPERAVLVAVGDFDVDAMEAKLKARFSDWQASGPAGPAPDLGTPISRSPETKLVVEPGAPLSLQVAWVRPPDESPDTLDKRRAETVRQLAFAVLNRRLQTLARGDAPPFIGAYGYKDERFHSAEITTLAITAQPGDWRSALLGAATEQRRLVQYGVRQDELDREINELRSELQARAAGIATRTTQQFSDSIVDTLDEREVFTSPVQDLAIFDAAVKGLKAQTVSQAAKALFEGQGPLVFVASPTPIEGGEAAITQAYAEVQKATVTAGDASTSKAWPYASFGAPGKVAEQSQMADLGVTLVRFDNGVRLTVRPSKFKDDEILVRVRIGNGLLDMPKDRPNTLWAAEGAFTEGGLKDLTAEQIDQILVSKIYSAQFDAGEDAFVLQGRTRPQDFATQLQVLAAYAQEPGFRPAAFQRMKTYASTLHDQMEATPGGVIARDLPALQHGGDPRFQFPSTAEIAAATADQFKTELQPRVGDGPVEIVIVGDISVDEAVRQVAATFGALPKRTGPEVSPASRTVSFPGPNATPVVLTHKGRADQAAAYMAWPIPDFFHDPVEARMLRVVSAVFETRLLDELREAQGVTYSPQASANSSLVFTGYGYMAAAVEVPPDKLDDFFQSAEKIAADLAAKPITQDELDRAKKPLIEGLGKTRQSNEYWLEQLSGAQAEPRKFDAIRSVVPAIERVTPADVQREAAAWLKPAKAWKLEVVPAAGAVKAAAG